MHPVDDSSDAAAQRRPKRLSMLLVGTVAMGMVASAFSQVLKQREDLVFFDTGPLRIREQFLPTVGFLSLEPASAGVLETGHWQVDLVYTAPLAYEHQLTPTSSVVLQVQGTESPFEDLGIRDLGDRAYLFDIGIKKGFSRSTVVFLALSENVVNFGNSADVGLHLGLTWTH